MSAAPALPQGQFGCILADPPWAFQTYNEQRKTPTAKDWKAHAGVFDHYPTMSVPEMASLPIAQLAAKDCALFMWLVGSHLPDAIELASAWGFTFKTDAFYWLKQRMIDAQQCDLFTGDIPEPIMGMGLWTRKQVEPCWLFTRGKPKRLSKGVRQAIIEPRREHSRKPDSQYERIEALVKGPYLKLFARNTRPGWESWGNEVGKFEEVAA